MNKEDDQLFIPGQFELTSRFREAVEAENLRAPLVGKPKAKFDEKRNVPYLLFPDGRRIYETQDK